MSTNANPGRRWMATVFLTMTWGLSGCAPSTTAHRVEPTRAKEMLQEVLESWKRGETPEAWRSREPQVVIQDMDWKSGAELIDFEILADATAIDANLHCQVKLKLSHSTQGRRERIATYLVGTSPVLTVFRSPGL